MDIEKFEEKLTLFSAPCDPAGDLVVIVNETLESIQIRQEGDGDADGRCTTFDFDYHLRLGAAQTLKKLLTAAIRHLEDLEDK